jgi:hypothetical protein
MLYTIPLNESYNSYNSYNNFNSSNSHNLNKSTINLNITKGNNQPISKPFGIDNSALLIESSFINNKLLFTIYKIIFFLKNYLSLL